MRRYDPNLPFLSALDRIMSIMKMELECKENDPKYEFHYEQLEVNTYEMGGTESEVIHKILELLENDKGSREYIRRLVKLRETIDRHPTEEEREAITKSIFEEYYPNGFTDET